MSFEKLGDYPQYAELFADYEASYEALKAEALSLVLDGHYGDSPYSYGQQGTWNAAAFRWDNEAQMQEKAPVAYAFGQKWKHCIKNGLYSLLGAMSFIPEHTEPTRIMRCHLPLIVPTQDADTCGIRVGDEIRPFALGKVFLFRDFKPHEVWNMTDTFRVNMILDLIDPNYED
jgi:aspartyl/asparaginyl beta-hydroxylase (cupin superfamily)